MLQLKRERDIKVIFDPKQSISVSTQKLNDKGVAGSAVDIWANITSKPAIPPSSSTSMVKIQVTTRHMNKRRSQLSMIDRTSICSKSPKPPPAMSPPTPIATTPLAAPSAGSRSPGLSPQDARYGAATFNTSKLLVIYNQLDHMHGDHVAESDDEHKTEIVYQDETSHKMFGKRKSIPL